MSCSPFDLKDYFFGELPEPARKETESHLAGCMACRDELAALDLTRAALLSVPAEEPPRRIAFVSDKVFEPRWWQRMWNSRPQLGFAAAAMLAAAIVAHGFMMQPPAHAVATVQPVQPSEAEIAKRIEAEVAKAMAESEERQLARTVSLVNASLKQARLEQRETLLMIRDYVERVQKERSVVRKAAYYDQ
jgi:anti-sigma factor RsiW